MLRRIFIVLIVLVHGFSTTASAGIYTYAENSILANGKWAKIKVNESGVYKLTYQNLIQMGFSDPSKVRVYGFGGAMLPEAFKYPKADTQANGDLPEVSLYSGSDYILFWAQGVVSWSNTGTVFTHTVNPYSSYAYYFLTDSKGAPTAMPVESSISDPSITISTFDDYALHEKDLENIGATGREFYGESFSQNNTQTFPFTINGVTDTKPMLLGIDFISKSVTGTTFKSYINNATIINSTFPKASTDYFEFAKAQYYSGSYTNSAHNNLFNVKIEYGKSSETHCNLNYIRLNMERALKLYGTFTAFRSIAAKGQKVQYSIQNTNANVKIWDITNYKSKEITSTLNGSELKFAVESPVNQIREFVAVDVNASFPQPTYVGEVTNQNLHALPQTDMVIICPAEFTSAAEKIANLHRDPQKDNLRVTIVQPEQIYNEFSSGTPDATAYRWFLKMFYDRAQTAQDKPKYLLLFGDGTYDNRLLGSEWMKADPANKILTYESAASLVETSSYVCDDYFGILDDNEGQNLVADGLDLGIGRFPVRTTREAENVANKIINYSSNQQLGPWKNNLCFVADDGDDNGHMKQSYQLTQNLETNYKQLIPNKIFFDSFKKIITSTGGSYPSARKKLFDQLNNGVLALNYTGHGSANSWSVEQILTISDIKSMNLKKLPLWITATCDFSRFDDFNTTAGEEVLLNPIGGGIGLITTTRVVYSAQNFRLNTALNEFLYKRNSDGSRLRLGDIIRLTKIALGTTDQNKLNFTLLGDPALKLAYPEYKMEITGINGSADTQTLSALSEVTITGKVLKPNGEFDPNFNGVVNPTVFDCEENITTLDNDKTGIPFVYKDRSKILYNGKDSIRNGLFSFKFTVPKDMSYSYQSGRINLYGSDALGNEAQGYYEKFSLGGTNPNANFESQGPTIKNIYLDSSNFTNGDIVSEQPLLVVDLEDQCGVNVSGTGIGHDMTLSIDESPSNTYVLNSYYETNNGSSNTGRVSYILPKLSEGKHSLLFRVWDIQNNSSTQTIECVVKKEYTPPIFDLFSKTHVQLSNPEVLFYLKHDLPNKNINLRINLYNLSGTEIWAHSESGISDQIAAFPIKWNLKDSSGNPVLPGIYLYKATIYTDKEEETTLTKKLIILSQ